MEHGFIEQIVNRTEDDSRITGWFIHVSHMSSIYSLQTCTSSNSVPVVKQNTSALKKEEKCLKERSEKVLSKNPLDFLLSSFSKSKINALKKAEKTSENSIADAYNYMIDYKADPDKKPIIDDFAFMYKVLKQDWGLEGSEEDWIYWRQLQQLGEVSN